MCLSERKEDLWTLSPKDTGFCGILPTKRGHVVHDYSTGYSRDKGRDSQVSEYVIRNLFMVEGKEK